MNKSTKLMLTAAILIGICNVIPLYGELVFHSEIFNNLSSIWKLGTSFYILILYGKKIADDKSGTFSGFPYGAAFSWSFCSCLLSSIPESILTIVYILLKGPEYADKLIGITLSQAEKNPAFTSEMENMIIKMIDFAVSPLGTVLSCVMSAVFVGAIISLIVAAIIRKDGDPTAETDDDAEEGDQLEDADNALSAE